MTVYGKQKAGKVLNLAKLLYRNDLENHHRVDFLELELDIIQYG